MDIKFLNFNQLRNRAIESQNKVAFMVDVFKTLHDDAPPEDFKQLGGRLAGILKQANNDYCHVLQIMWKTSADGIMGSHLNWIQKILTNSKQKGFMQKPEPKLARVSVKELAEKDKGDGR
jgi:hypothetical protein